MTYEISHTDPSSSASCAAAPRNTTQGIRFKGLIHAALSFGVCLGLSFAATSPLLGAKVKKVVKAKKRAYIDLGKEDGVKKGSRICFFKKAKKRKVTCGKVLKAWDNKSVVRVKKIGKIKKGMQAAISTKGRKKMAKDMDKAMMAGAKEQPSLLKVNYIMSLATASAYNNLSYVYEENTRANTVWEPITAANAALLGFGLDYERPMFGNTVALGFKYKIYTSSQGKTGSFITSNFGNDANRFILVSQEATSMGFFADYLYLDYKLSKNLVVKVGNGLDFDIATMTLTADERDDTDAGINERIYEASSTATTISLRTVANAYVMFGSFGIGGGVNLMVPLTTSLKQEAAANNRFAAASLEEGITAEEDVLRMIDHRKNSFGLEFLFSTFYAF